MADDTRENTATAAAAGAAGAGAGALPKKFPKGVVLGKDGKPCRSCTSFAAWSSQTASSLSSASSSTSSTSTSPFSTTSSQSSLSSPTQKQGPPPDCPPDVLTLGRSSWTLLHSIAASYPTSPSITEQKDLSTFMSLFSKLYPCWTCAEDFQAYMAREKIRTGSRKEFGMWLCEAHNDVNVKLGKERFDCGRWEERWRDGWRDGRCD